MVHLTKLQERFKDRVDFFFIYITEAHPENLSLELTKLFDKQPEGLCPTTPQSQQAVIKSMRDYGVQLPIYFDINGKAEEMFKAGPTSLILLSPKGSVLRAEPLLGEPVTSEGEETPEFKIFGEWLDNYFRKVYKTEIRARQMTDTVHFSVTVRSLTLC